MYDDRYTFSAYNNGGTFSHNTGADGEVFGKAPALQSWWGDKGAVTNACCNEHENYPLDSYQSGYTLSAPGGVETISKLKQGGSYFREKGVNHNVLNNNDFIYKFIEIEFK